MALSSVDHNSGHHPGFSCFKSFAPVRYPQRWYRTALIDAALNPRVQRIGPSPIQNGRLPDQAGFSFWASIEGVSTLVLLSDAGCEVGDLAQRIAVKSVTRTELSIEPEAGLRREIWSHVRQGVSIEMVYAVLIEAYGDSDQVTLGALRDAGGHALGDVAGAIYSMIATGFLEVDIRNGWSPSVPVRRGPMAEKLLDPHGFSNPAPVPQAMWSALETDSTAGARQS